MGVSGALEFRSVTRGGRQGGAPLAALLAALLAGALAGCGGHGRTSSTTSDASTAPSGPTLAGRLPVAALFSRDCGACHSLTVPARRNQQGGELGAAHLSLAEIRQLTAEMPRLHGALSAAEVAVLSRYVASAQRR